MAKSYDYKYWVENPLTEEKYNDQWREFTNTMDDMMMILTDVVDKEHVLESSNDDDDTVDVSDSQQSLPVASDFQDMAVTSFTASCCFEPVAGFEE
ncbi:hypothetical protein N0V82_007808 [Gnomoniopsis sp. IMI 355080]|nr:hypothetical protein N0V82_007808 [Gnomoniopsis sp. IMI 355080]